MQQFLTTTLNPKELKIFGVSNCNMSLLTDKNFPLYVDLGYNTALMSETQKEYVNSIRSHVAVQHRKAKELQINQRQKCEEAANLSQMYALQRQSTLKSNNLSEKLAPIKPYLRINYNENPDAPLTSEYFATSKDDFVALLAKVSDRRSISPAAFRESWLVRRETSPDRKLKLPRLGYTRLEKKFTSETAKSSVGASQCSSLNFTLPSLGGK